MSDLVTRADKDGLAILDEVFTVIDKHYVG